jgi:hypothetical protein
MQSTNQCTPANRELRLRVQRMCDPAGVHRRGFSLCAEHDRQLGGGTPLSSLIGGEGLMKRKGLALRERSPPRGGA